MSELIRVPEDFEGSSIMPREDMVSMSPNKWRREVKIIDRIVLHATAGTTYQGALSRIMDKSSEASYHLLITNPQTDGKLMSIRLVPDDWKAGGVRRQCRDPIDGRTDINSRALHLSFVHTAGDAPYDMAMVELGIKWIHYWVRKYPIKWIYSHALVDPLRRKDPGKTFPFSKLVASMETHVPAPYAVRICVDGKEITEALDPEVYEGATYVKLRPLLEELGLNFTYDKFQKAIHIGRPKNGEE
jgi:N-acetyl-anhydromuramyl-L-alanine amidase AmpD